MRRYPRALDYFCPKCGANLQNQTNVALSIQTCKRCEKTQELFKCLRKTCRFQHWMCFYCDPPDIFEEHLRKDNKCVLTSTVENVGVSKTCGWVLLLIVVPLIIVLMYGRDSKESFEDVNIKLIKNLKKDFPSQRNETWYHLLSVLEKGIPSVKSITFLHGEDRRTPDCLTKKLVFLYSGNKNIKSEEITFSAVGYEEMDYGFALEHCRLIVNTSRVFVTDLIKVPGKIARIFHSLCDEVSSDIKPSLFIFTLKFDERTEKLKPLDRAATILKETWSDLPDNEIFPLLSRIVKNVVEVVPEEETTCF